MRLVTSWRAVLLTLAAILFGAGCAVHARAVAPRAAQIRVTERDFHIFAPKRVAGGDVVVTVANKGPDDHELIIVRATKARLPVRRDGLTVNEEKLGRVTDLSIDPGAPGSVRKFHLHLQPGYYVLFCNMAGHFMAGMHTTLVVQ